MEILQAFQVVKAMVIVFGCPWQDDGVVNFRYSGAALCWRGHEGKVAVAWKVM